MRAALYARVSTHDQQTLGMQVDAMSAYLKDRGWKPVRRVEDVGSGARDRPGRESLLKAARRREIDVVVVWCLDRWGRSLPDPIVTLRELTDLDIGFVSLTEALDLTTPSGRALAGMLAVFAEFEREILRERVRAGIARARKQGRDGEPLGDRASAGDRQNLGAADSRRGWHRYNVGAEMTERPRLPPVTPDSRASGPCRTVPGTIMATSRHAFQTYSTGRLPSAGNEHRP